MDTTGGLGQEDGTGRYTGFTRYFRPLRGLRRLGGGGGHPNTAGARDIYEITYPEKCGPA